MASEGLDPAALTFTFRPLRQLDAAEQAQVALGKAQATAVYAGLGLWPAETTAALVRSQLLEDGVYPGAGEVFGAEPAPAPSRVTDYSPDQPRDPEGRWTTGGGSRASTGQQRGHAPSKPEPPSILGQFLNALNPIGTAQAQEIGPEASSAALHAPDGTPIEAAATTTNFKYACKVLKIDPMDASDALHAAKNAARLKAADNCAFDTTTGDIMYQGEVIGNLKD